MKKHTSNDIFVNLSNIYLTSASGTKNTEHAGGKEINRNLKYNEAIFYRSIRLSAWTDV